HGSSDEALRLPRHVQLGRRSEGRPARAGREAGARRGVAQDPRRIHDAGVPREEPAARPGIARRGKARSRRVVVPTEQSTSSLNQEIKMANIAAYLSKQTLDWMLG